MDYFEGRHIPLFILAIFILLFAVIYKIIIFSWQWVVRLPKIWILKWTNNQKLNSFIQTYQAPFCDRHRYWTGLLLLERVLLTCISILTANAHPNALLLSIISVLGFLLLLRLTYAKNLYKKWPVDLLETVLIINLFVFTLAVYISDDVSKKRIFAYISVTFVLLLLLIVIAYHIYAYILVGAFPKLKRARGKQMTRPKPNSQSNVANNLQEIPGRVFYSRDRYHEMVGSIELANTDHQLPQLNPLPAEPTANLKPQVPSIIISSFLDLLDCDSEVEHQPQQPGLLTVTKDDNFDSPYRIFDSSPSKPTASDNACLSTLHYEELEESGDLN